MTRPPTVYMCVSDRQSSMYVPAQYVTTKRVGNVESYDVQTKVHIPTYQPTYCHARAYTSRIMYVAAAEFMLIARTGL